MPTLEETLQKYYGFSTFRAPQKEIMESILSGRDTLALLPTGTGKSLCFQLPSLLLPFPTLVISPLLALMQDQVESLTRRGIPAAAITSDTSQSEKTTILHSLQRNTTRFVYLSPEQLLSATQAELLKIPLSHICIDEAHCISEWGHDFRPEYQKIGTFLTAYTRFHDRPVLSAFTATAHATVKKDILQFFPLQNPQQFSLPYWRENIDYCVREIISEAQKRRAWLEILTWWQENELAKCLVYVPTRIDAEFYADWARQRGFSAQAFHAGLSLAKRKALLAKFQTTPMSILIATTAFGMGIDIPDIRVVVHLSPPITLSAYAQESGRAGRDGQRSWCFLLFRGEDLHQNLTLFFSPNKQRHRHQKKEAHLVYRWARESACLARSLRMYFETEQKDTQKIIGCRCSRCQRVTSTTPLALFCPRAPSTQT